VVFEDVVADLEDVLAGDNEGFVVLTDPAVYNAVRGFPLSLSIAFSA